jgi:hypothetical protein
MTREQAAEDDLRSTSEAIRSDASEIYALEAEKSDLHPGDPKVSEISQRVVDISDRMQRATLVEQELTEEVRAAHAQEHDRRTTHRRN